MFFRADGTPVENLSWQAPTENTDGSPIEQSLTYNLYSATVADPTEAVAVSSFPGVLNPDGSYTTPLADTAAFDTDGEYFLWLTAVDEDDDESDFSNGISIVRRQSPNSPTGFAAI